MAKLEIQIHENTSATKDVAPYLGTFISKGTINFAALAEQAAKLSGLPVIQIEAILRGAFDEFGDLEREGPVRINFDGGCICVIIKGRFESSDAAFDPEKNSLEIAWHLSDNIRNSLVNEVPKIVTDETSTKVRLNIVTDEKVTFPDPVTMMESVCMDASFTFDPTAGATLTLAFEDGTELTHSVTIGA